MNVKKGLYYTESHEWLEVDGDTGTVGISDYAQEELGDVAYIDLPEEGIELKKGEELCEIESVKAVSDVYTPISGEVIEVNTDLEDVPEEINEEPYDVWIAKIAIKDKKEIEELMNAEEYEEYLETL
ncbi:MAG: glycine cleavage system protein GcvH [Euryarchaeota archaeon]|nr:glycine cleavage system protein GcvH [Euryarchaeota archaeon]